MFSKLLSNLRGSESSKDTKIQDKIFRMSLVDMRIYVNGGLSDFEVDEYGLHEVVKKLMSVNEETSKRFLEIDDMDSKKQKALNLIILILENKKISLFVIEAIQKFLEIYDELIKKYDKENKQIYESRIKKLMSLAIKKIDTEANIINVMEVSK